MELAAIIALITQLTPVVTNLINVATTARAAAQQTGEWTPEAEAAYQGLLKATTSAPEWQPDPK